MAAMMDVRQMRGPVLLARYLSSPRQIFYRLP
jgi:hypothetical protein